MTYQQNSNVGGRVQNPGTQQYNDTITPICNFGFAFNHLFTVSLVQRTPIANLQKHDIKEKFFFFITLAPGVGDANNRTYDFQNGRINQKFAIRELAALSEVLKHCASGNDINVLPYTKFSRNAGDSKNLSIWISQKQQQHGQTNSAVKSINLSVSSGQVKHNISLTADQAFGISKVLDKMFDKAIDLEIQAQMQAPIQNQIQNQPIQQQFNQPLQQQFYPNFAASYPPITS